MTDEKTSPNHEIPAFVGTPPERIDGAPEWANELFFRLNEGRQIDWSRNRESIHELRNQLQLLSGNVEMLAHEFERYSVEMRERTNWQERELGRLKTAVADLDSRVSRLEK